MQDNELVAIAFAGHWLTERESEYGGVKQRWIAVESQERKSREFEALEKKLIQLDNRVGKELERLSKVEFACEEDTLEAAGRFTRKYSRERGGSSWRPMGWTESS